jgi:hypothetical protein
MTLVETYKAVAPAVVAFASRYARGQRGTTPLAPQILGTGFFVHEDGIVATNRHIAEMFAGIPNNPQTGKLGVVALVADYQYPRPEDQSSFRMMAVEILKYLPFLGSATADAWYGEKNPDIAFVQLKLKGVPFLKLASHDFYIQPGTQIATAGFPLGSLSLTVTGKWNQFIPFVRSGIVSSVFPSIIPQPHGLTIDIMQQGGSSGSPIFYADDPTVVGMMATSVLEPIAAVGPQLSVQIGLNTNISIAVPAHIVEQTLQAFLKEPLPGIDRSSLPNLNEWRQQAGEPQAPDWTELGPG